MKFVPQPFVARLLCLVTLISLCIVPIKADPATSPTQQQSNAAAALQQGRRLLKRGNADQALIQLRTALDLYTAAKSRRGIAATHNELGDLYFRQGQSKIALEHYQSAYDALSGALGEEQRTTAAASGAARVADPKASQLTETAASVSDTGFNAQLLLAKIGDTNFRLGQMSAAASSYSRMNPKKPESAAKKAGGLFGRIAPSIAVGEVADSAALGSAAGAIGGALAAKNELDQYRTSIVYMTYHLGMGRIAFAGNDLDGARKHFQEAADAGKGALPMIANLGQTRRFNAAARTSLGDVALRQGNLKQANNFYKDAVKEARDDKRPDLMWPAQRGLGRSQWLQAAKEKDAKKAMQAREAALVNYREALQNIETLRAGSLRADESRTTFLSTTKDVFDEAASSFAKMALLTAGPAASSGLSGKSLEYAAEAFKVTEQSRARSLLDLLSETNASITEGVPPDLLKQKQENLDQQQQIAEQLTGIALSPDEPKRKPGDLERELEKLQAKFDEIENQIRLASPSYKALTSNQPLTLAEVQQKVLDDQTVLLEYSLGSDASYLWAVSSKEVKLYELAGRPTLDKLVEDLRAHLIPPKLRRRIVSLDAAADQARGLGVVSASEDAAPLAAAAHALYKAIVEPAAAFISNKRLLIVADGGLNYIPFEALVTSAAGGDYASLPYLIKSNEIVYAPSASVVGAIREQKRPDAGSNILIIADPVFNSADPRARGVAASSDSAETRGLGLASALSDVEGQAPAAASSAAKMQGLPLARLPGTRSEAEQISALAKKSGLQADVWWDLNANEDNVETRDVSKYRVIHIATHGLLNVERPQFTGLVLSLVGNKSTDGFLRTDEVFNLRLGSPLVMLSACETGVGKQKRGEGVLGLTRAFLYAGAPTVGVSLWSVADKSTAELMTDFYHRLIGGTSSAANGSPTAAMREAQLAMITGKRYSAPFYWAPFVLVGDWR